MSSKRRTARYSSARVLLLTLTLALAACGGGGGGNVAVGGSGGGVGATTLPADDGTLLGTVGLIGAAAGDSSVQVRWDATDADGNPVTIAVFRSTSPQTVYLGAPILNDPPGDTALITGLANGVAQYFGLAIAQGAGNFEPAGEVLLATPDLPIYVDAASTAAQPDGSSPAKAYPDLISGVLTAFTFGGGNVWVAAGDYQDTAVPIWSGVHVYGGFGPTFDLAARDPAVDETRLYGRVGAAILKISNGGAGGVVDGVVVDGLGISTFGIDVDETPAQLRSLEVKNCLSDGIRVRSLSTTSDYDLSVTRCSSSANGGDGLSLDGAFDLSVEGSRFAANKTEGLELGGLLAPEGVPVVLRVRDSIFSGNGSEGLDCDLVPPAVTGPGGGSYHVSIEDSVFELNGVLAPSASASGLNVDIDFELVQGWQAKIEIRGCITRGNAGHGVRLDLDSTASTIVHRLLSTGNGGDGVSVSSESTPGIATISASALVGNRGVGARASLGNVGLLVSHSVLAGNELGGARSEMLESSIVSSVGWLQPAFVSGFRDHFNTVVTDPAASPFVTVPVAYLGLLAFDGQVLTLDDASGLAIGDRIELIDDGVLRAVASFVGPNEITVGPSPAYVPGPTLLSRFPHTASFDEDYQLVPGSPASGSGMVSPASGPADCGIFGSPSGGLVGREELDPATLFFASATNPPLSGVLGPNDDFEVSFEGGTIDSLTVNALTVRVADAGGALIGGASSFVLNGRLVVSPPGGGWPQGDLTLELLEGLTSTAGTPLGTPVALPLRAQ